MNTMLDEIPFPTRAWWREFGVLAALAVVCGFLTPAALTLMLILGWK